MIHAGVAWIMFVCCGLLLFCVDYCFSVVFCYVWGHHNYTVLNIIDRRCRLWTVIWMMIKQLREDVDYEQWVKWWIMQLTEDVDCEQWFGLWIMQLAVDVDYEQYFWWWAVILYLEVNDRVAIDAISDSIRYRALILYIEVNGHSYMIQ